MHLRVKMPARRTMQSHDSRIMPKLHYNKLINYKVRFLLKENSQVLLQIGAAS